MARDLTRIGNERGSKRGTIHIALSLWTDLTTCELVIGPAGRPGGRVDG